MGMKSKAPRRGLARVGVCPGVHMQAGMPRQPSMPQPESCPQRQASAHQPRHTQTRPWVGPPWSSHNQCNPITPPQEVTNPLCHRVKPAWPAFIHEDTWQAQALPASAQKAFQGHGPRRRAWNSTWLPYVLGNRLSYISNILLCFSPTNRASIYLGWKCAQLKDYISQPPLQ